MVVPYHKLLIDVSENSLPPAGEGGIIWKDRLFLSLQQVPVASSILPIPAKSYKICLETGFAAKSTDFEGKGEIHGERVVVDAFFGLIKIPGLGIIRKPYKQKLDLHLWRDQ